MNRRKNPSTKKSRTPARTTNLYDLMDAAYDAEAIRQHSRSLGHVPLIDINPRNDKALAEELKAEAQRLKRLGFALAEQVRYHERTAGERVNGRLKDEFGGRHVRVRGASKVMCHCMFGLLALTADQLMRLVTLAGNASSAPPLKSRPRRASLVHRCPNTWRKYLEFPIPGWQPPVLQGWSTQPAIQEPGVQPESWTDPHPPGILQVARR